MPHTVRTHTRRTASGRTVTVRQHDRKGGSASRPAGRSRRKRAAILLAGTSAVLAVSIIAGAATIIPGVIAVGCALVYCVLAWRTPRVKHGRHAESWWAEEPPAAGPRRLGDREMPALQAEMRQWRRRPVPQAPPEDLDPQMAKLLGCDTPEGRASYDRLRAYREAGYTGPLDEHNRIPDPDDPANYELLHSAAAMREQRA